MIGWAVRLWGFVALLIYAILTYGLPTRDNARAPAPVTASPVAAPTRTAYMNSQVFRAGSTGHVVLDADVNGTPIKFLVDTGATMVVLTMRDAAAVGLGNLEFTMRTATANGIARAAPVTLREIRIRDLAIDDVAAAVAENLNVSLLGQSFLTRLDSYEMHDGVLTLNYY